MGKFVVSEKTNGASNIHLRVRNGPCQKFAAKLRCSSTTSANVISRVSKLSSRLGVSKSEKKITKKFEKRLRRDCQQIMESMEPRAMASVLEELYVTEITSGRTREVYRKDLAYPETSSIKMMKKYHRHLKCAYKKTVQASAATKDSLSRHVWREPTQKKLFRKNRLSIVAEDDGRSVYVTPSLEVDELALMLGGMSISDDNLYRNDSSYYSSSELSLEMECEDYDDNGDQNQEEISLSITNMLHQIRKEVDKFRSMSEVFANSSIRDVGSKRKLRNCDQMEISSDEEDVEDEGLIRAAKRKFVKPRRERNALYI